ncbi:MAG: wax ester/triacylglycerol synthase family O-acyltransferase [Gammaproteobacteria bacterium]|jgi:WS/DGAT/MGAT family acyltransferase
MEQLESLDSAFIYLETRNAPMHIGSVQIYEGTEARFDFARYRELVRSRLPLSPVFRRRAVRVPMNLGRPYWVEDPNFDLDLHLEHVSLPRPGGWKELRALAQDRFSSPLDPHRPLWSMTFVEGLDGISGLPPGSFAVISKIHHAAADGMGGVDLFSALWDPTPVGRSRLPRDRWKPEPLPHRTGLLGRTVSHLVGQPAALARAAGALVRGSIGIGRELLTGDKQSPRLLFKAPRTRFNDTIETQRSFGGITLPLAGIKVIKDRVEGATVNDVVLAVCSGALRAYLQDKDELPEEPLVAMAPISVREEMDRGSNRVSAMLVNLATDVRNPKRRFRSIMQSTQDSKAYTKAIGAATLTDSTQVVPFSLATAASRLYSRMHVATYHRPPFNLIITNVPGPRMTLYLGGAKMSNVFGMAPVLDGLGMIMVVVSYAEHLTISVNASRHQLPDPDLLLRHLLSAYDEIEQAICGPAAGAGGKTEKKRRRRVKTKAAGKPAGRETRTTRKKKRKTPATKSGRKSAAASRSQKSAASKKSKSGASQRGARP